jgi:hypothetical protein
VTVVAEEFGNGPSEGVSLPEIERHVTDTEARKALSKRFSPEEQRGLSEGGRIHEEASLVAGRGSRPGETQDELNDRQENQVESYAKDKGVWDENPVANLTQKYGEPINSEDQHSDWIHLDQRKFLSMVIRKIIL